MLDIVHVAGYEWNSAKALYSNSTDAQAFARRRKGGQAPRMEPVPLFSSTPETKKAATRCE
jgi:hypothetical protein